MYLGCIILKLLLFDVELEFVMSCCPECLHPVLDSADLPQQRGDGGQCVGEVRIGGEVRGGCGVDVLVNPGALTGQLLNVQHLQRLPADELVSLKRLLCLLNGVGHCVLSKGFYH